MALVVLKSTRNKTPPTELASVGCAPRNYVNVSVDSGTEKPNTHNVLQFPSSLVFALPLDLSEEYRPLDPMTSGFAGSSA